MNERFVAEFNNLVFPEPAERRSFLLESVKHTLSNQWKLPISVWDWNGSKWTRQCHPTDHVIPLKALASSNRAGSPPEIKLRKVTVRALNSATWTILGFAKKNLILFHLFLAVLADDSAPWWKSTWAGQKNLHLSQGGILKHLHSPCDLFRLWSPRVHRLRLKGKMAGMLLLKYSSDRSGAGVSVPQNQFGKSRSDQISAQVETIFCLLFVAI